jgi:hypothetical protein
MKKPRLTPSQIRFALKSATACDAIVTTKDWLRSFWYEENWQDGVDMAKYDKGNGDHVFVFFTSDGQTIIKGFDHESQVSPHARDKYEVWPGIYDGAPPALMEYVKDVSVEHEDVTFCCWSVDGASWNAGSAVIPEEIDDGSNWLMEMLQMNSEAFINWAQSYYEKNFDRIGVEGVLKVFGIEEEPT